MLRGIRANEVWKIVEQRSVSGPNSTRKEVQANINCVLDACPLGNCCRICEPVPTHKPSQLRRFRTIHRHRPRNRRLRAFDSNCSARPAFRRSRTEREESTYNLGRRVIHNSVDRRVGLSVHPVGLTASLLYLLGICGFSRGPVPLQFPQVSLNRLEVAAVVVRM